MDTCRHFPNSSGSFSDGYKHLPLLHLFCALIQATYPKLESAESPNIEASAQVTEQEDDDEENDEFGAAEPLYITRSTMTCEEDYALPDNEEPQSSESDDDQSDVDYREEKELLEGDTELKNRDRNRNEYSPPKLRRTCTFEECIENLHRGRPVHYCSGDANPCERNKCPVGVDGIGHGSREFHCAQAHGVEHERPPSRASKKRNRGDREANCPSNRR